MTLTEEQTAAVAEWVRGGAALPEVQKRLEQEFGIRATYMDVRFLVDDLDLELVNSGPEFKDPLPKQPDVAAAPGKVRVSMDKITRPGALVSGQVTFSDGKSAQWFLDQMGRLSLNPSQPDYRPSPEDVQAFQTELRTVIEKSGMY